MTEASAPVGSWRAVPGFEGWYEISHRGFVRSLDRRVRNLRARSGTGLKRGKVLSPAAHSRTGHLYVHLCRNGKRELRYVHRLVLEAFAEPRPLGMDALHGPAGVRVNWWPENLYWGTPGRNHGIDRHRDGTMTHAKLTPELVILCRQRRAAGEEYAVLSLDYGVGWMTVRDAVVGKTWPHVSGAVQEKATATSRFRGVSWHQRNAKWQAQIHVDSRTVHLGVWADEEQAARAYDAAARQHHGEFGRYNFPDTDQDHPGGDE